MTPPPYNKIYMQLNFFMLKEKILLVWPTYDLSILYMGTSNSFYFMVYFKLSPANRGLWQLSLCTKSKQGLTLGPEMKQDERTVRIGAF